MITRPMDCRRLSALAFLLILIPACETPPPSTQPEYNAFAWPKSDPPPDAPQQTPGRAQPRPRDAEGSIGLFQSTTADEDPWSIRCITLRGPQRVTSASNVEKSLRTVKGLRGDLISVVHREEESVVYYGRYQRHYDPKTAQETFKPNPQRDLELIRSLSMDAPSQLDPSRVEPVWPFRTAQLEVVPAPDREKPEWDLNQVRNGYWSIHVAVFYNEGEMRRRKYAAVEYCRLLREQGEEAYYHHGPERSSVYVGIFPKSAIRSVQQEDPLTGRVTTVDRIVDEKMLAVQQRFPHSLQNGHKILEVKKTPGSDRVAERLAQPSFPVRIPWAERQEQGVLDF